MVTRRRALELTGASLAALAGCLSEDAPGSSGERTGGDSDTGSATDGDDVTTVPDDLDEWTPGWTLDAELSNAVALDTDEDSVYVTLNSDGGPSAVTAIDPADHVVEWRTEFAGEAVGRSHVERHASEDTWGVTVTDGAIYSVNGRDETYEWTAIHAIDPDTGAKMWSVRRERRLAVQGVGDGTVLATGTEFFEPEHSHDTPSAPLSTSVYGIDVGSGDVRWSMEYAGVTDATTGSGGAYVTTENRLHAISLDGTERWSVAATPRAVVPLDDVIVLAGERGDHRSALRAFTPDGTEQWTETLPVDSFLPHGDRLYALGGTTAAVTADGDIAWRVDGPGKWPLLAPDGETLYSRSGRRADAVDAFPLPDGGRRFQFDAPSDNAWPAGATDDLVVAEAITPEAAEFTSLFAVDEQSGEPLAAFRPEDTVFSVEGFDDTAYAGIGGSILAFERP